MRVFIVILLLSFIELNVLAQKPFQGIIRYEMAISGTQAEHMKGMMGGGKHVWMYKGENTRQEQEMMGMKITNITDSKNGLMYVLKNDAKVAYKMDRNKAKPKADEGKEPPVEKLDEVLEIQGYKCQKYKIIAQSSMGEQQIYVWATKELKMPSTKDTSLPKDEGLHFKGIDGMPLKSVMDMMNGAIKITLTAVEVKVEKLDDELFKIPKDYKIEDFDPMKLMGK